MPTILIVDDDAALRDSLAETVHDLGHQAKLAASGREALAILASDEIDGVLLDLRMPSGMDGIEVLRRIRLARPSATPSGVPSDAAVGTLIGSSEPMRRVQKTIGLTADSDTTVLILGETGTGKELVARALHEHGRRKHKPFVAVNCAAIPADLLESELFGRMKGAFTGAAADRAGAFREADGGTLFLDEIGDMPAAMQAKILRALQERVVTPVGGRQVPVDARVIAATHRDLPTLVAQGAFRGDLYYRLNVVPIALPPLRERRADIAPLAEHFLNVASTQGGTKRLTATAVTLLLGHSWPGNVRELRNVIERANILVRGEVIDAGDLDLMLAAAESMQQNGLDLPTAVARLEEAMIRKTLAAYGGNRAEAARRLNIHRQLLYTKMQRFGLTDEDVSANPTPTVGKADS